MRKISISKKNKIKYLSNIKVFSGKGIICIFLAILFFLYIIRGYNSYIYNNAQSSVNSSNNVSGTSSSQKQFAVVPLSLVGNYFALDQEIKSTKERSFAIYQTNDNGTTQIAKIGNSGEHVNNVILIKKKRIMLITYSNKIALLDLNNAVFRDLYIVPHGEFINYGLLSSDETNYIFQVTLQNNFKIVVLNLENFSTKDYSFDLFKKYLLYAPYMNLVFWSSNSEVFISPVAEGGSKYLKFNILSGKVRETNFYGGEVSPDKSKIAGADRLPPYGGCYSNEDFYIYWNDPYSEVRTNISKWHNTDLYIIKWNPDSDELLFSAQEYQIISDSPYKECPSAELKEKNYFVYNFKTNKTRSVNSEEEQLELWYPRKEEKDFITKSGLSGEKDIEKKVSYIGSITD